MLAASFTLCFLEALDKNSLYYHSIMVLNAVYLIRIRCLPLYLIVKEKYIDYNEGVNTDAWL